MVEWLAAGEDAAISHETALALLGLSDTVPDAIHVTVPRNRRWYSAPSWVRVHTTTRPLGKEQTILRYGIRITHPERSIADAAEAGMQPEQVQMAVQQGLERGLTTPTRLLREMDDRSERVRQLIGRALADRN